MDYSFLADDSESDSGQSADSGDPNSVDEQHLEPPSDPGVPIHRARTQAFRTQLERTGDIELRVKEVLHEMTQRSLNLPLFLEAIFWGNDILTADATVRYARTALMTSEELPSLIRRWHRPPRSHGSGIRTKGAQAALEEWAKDCVGEIVDREMEAIAPTLYSPREKLSKDHLLGISLDTVAVAMQQTCPTVWALLRRASYRPKQETRNTMKNPDKVIMYMLAQASYMRSHHRSLIHKFTSVYLHACGISAKAFDMLHAIGVTMSHSWTYGGIKTLADRAMDEVKVQVQKRPWIISHDNLNIPFRVFEQRVDNRSHFDSGTGATIFVIPDPEAVSPDNGLLQAKRAEGMIDPITPGLIMNLEATAAPRVSAQMKYRVLRFLLEAPEFDRDSYRHKDSDLLKPPPPVHELRADPKYCFTQYVLRTVHLEEASYEGNDRVMTEFLGQIGLGSKDAQKELGRQRVIGWIGDQLTVSRILGLQNFRAEDFNAYDRMDHIRAEWGWLHLVMILASSMHTQYYGTRNGLGLAHAIDVLNRKYLAKVSTQGPFHHHLHEALYHVGEAHFRDLWMVIGHTTQLADLRQRRPNELVALAEEIIREHASTHALVKQDELPLEKQDQLRYQMTQWNRDILDYFELDHAMSVGDVGRMEDMLPRLLFRFAGGKNSHYTIAVLELLQSLHKELPGDAKEFIRNYCWLTNSTGRRNGFYPLDMAQEHNIKDIKYTFAAMGPGASWEYINRISPAIPVMRAVKAKMEAEVDTASRGHKHTSPDKEKDIQRLTESYSRSHAHWHECGRTFKSPRDKAPDYISKGIDAVIQKGVIERWWDNRPKYRSTEERWDSETSSNSMYTPPSSPLQD